MIRNERQYRASQAQRRRLLETRMGYSAAPQADPLAQSALLTSVNWLLDDVEAEIGAYETLRNGERREISAERLGVPEEAVQRDEAGGYARAGLDRLARIADLLGIRLRFTDTLAPNDRATG